MKDSTQPKKSKTGNQAKMITYRMSEEQHAKIKHEAWRRQMSINGLVEYAVNHLLADIEKAEGNQA